MRTVTVKRNIQTRAFDAFNLVVIVANVVTKLLSLYSIHYHVNKNIKITFTAHSEKGQNVEHIGSDSNMHGLYSAGIQFSSRPGHWQL